MTDFTPTDGIRNPKVIYDGRIHRPVKTSADNSKPEQPIVKQSSVMDYDDDVLESLLDKTR